jgi:hypothetical protein
MFPPTGHGNFIVPHRLRAELEAALKEVGLPALTWYQTTRHTFASHWIMDGRPIEKLREIMGHSSVTVTERYAHLAPGAFTAEDLAAVSVDLSDPKVLRLPVSSPGDSEASGTIAAQREGGASESTFQVVEINHGEMAEWSKAPDSKAPIIPLSSA